MDEKRVKIIASVFITVLIAGVVTLDLFFNPRLYQTEGQNRPQNNENQNEAGIILTQVRNENGNTGQENRNSITIIHTNENGNSGGGGTVINHLVTPEMLVAAGINNATIDDAKAGKELFSLRLETLSGDIVKRYVRQDDFPLGIIYEVDPSVSYDAIKTSVREKVAASPVWQINETNSFGSQSFYLNNTNRIDTTFLVTEWNGHIIGFEYPRANHAKFQSLFEQLQ